MNCIYLRRLGINLLLADTVGIGVTLNSGVENCSFFVTAALFGFGVAPLPPVPLILSPPSFCCFVNGSNSMLSFPLLLKAMIITIKLSQMSFVHTWRDDFSPYHPDAYLYSSLHYVINTPVLLAQSIATAARAYTTQNVFALALCAK